MIFVSVKVRLLLCPGNCFLYSLFAFTLYSHSVYTRSALSIRSETASTLNTFCVRDAHFVIPSSMVPFISHETQRQCAHRSRSGIIISISSWNNGKNNYIRFLLMALPALSLLCFGFARPARACILPCELKLSNFGKPKNVRQFSNLRRSMRSRKSWKEQEVLVIAYTIFYVPFHLSIIIWLQNGLLS